MKLAGIIAAGGSTPIRVSAIACLGILGDQSDLPMLARYASGTDARLKIPAQAAVNRRME